MGLLSSFESVEKTFHLLSSQSFRICFCFFDFRRYFSSFHIHPPQMIRLISTLRRAQMGSLFRPNRAKVKEFHLFWRFYSLANKNGNSSAKVFQKRKNCQSFGLFSARIWITANNKERLTIFCRKENTKEVLMLDLDSDLIVYSFFLRFIAVKCVQFGVSNSKLKDLLKWAARHIVSCTHTRRYVRIAICCCLKSADEFNDIAFHLYSMDWEQAQSSFRL